MGSKFKEIDINLLLKHNTHYFFNYMINIKKFDPNKIKIFLW